MARFLLVDILLKFTPSFLGAPQMFDKQWAYRRKSISCKLPHCLHTVDGHSQQHQIVGGTKCGNLIDLAELVDLFEVRTDLEAVSTRDGANLRDTRRKVGRHTANLVRYSLLGAFDEVHF